MFLRSFMLIYILPFRPQITKAVGVNGFLLNRKKNSHLLQSTRLYTTSKMDGIEKGKVIQPEIPAMKCESYQ